MRTRSPCLTTEELLLPLRIVAGAAAATTTAPITDSTAATFIHLFAMAVGSNADRRSVDAIEEKKEKKKKERGSRVDSRRTEVDETMSLLRRSSFSCNEARSSS